MQTKIRELETYIKQLNDVIFMKENALQRSRATVEALESKTKSLAETIATSEKKVEEKERELFEARESLSVAAEAQQRLHDVNLSLSTRLEEHGVVANDLQAQIQTLKTAAEVSCALLTGFYQRFSTSS
jgi:chromosome segregation ATPase